MTDATEVLVVILSVFLALFLIVSIVLVVLLIRVTQQIKSVTSAAQTTVQHIENAVVNVSKLTSPMLIAKFVTDQFKRAKSRKGGK